MKHRETHPVFVDGCFGCKIAGVGLLTAGLAQYRLLGESVRGSTERSVRRFKKERGFWPEKA